MTQVVTDDDLAAAFGVNVTRDEIVRKDEYFTLVTLKSIISNATAFKGGGLSVRLTGVPDAIPVIAVNVTRRVVAGCKEGFRCLGGVTIPCPPGTRGDEQGEYCLDCPAGTYQEREAQTACDPCPYGSCNSNTGYGYGR